MKKRKRALGLLLAVSLFLTGCGAALGTENKQEETVHHQTAGMDGTMGRYMEDISPLPEEINRNGGLNFLDDGSLSIISFGSGLYRSRDGGKSWKQEETDWFELLQNVYCLSAVMGPDGSVAASCVGEMPEAARAFCETDTAKDWEGNYLVFADAGGKISVADYGFTQEEETAVSSLHFHEDGRLFAGDMSGRVYEIDPESKKFTELFQAEREVGYIGFSGDILMAVGPDRLYLYDLSEKALLAQDETMDNFVKKTLDGGSVSYTGGGYPLAVFAGEEGILYLACQDGVYRHALGGSVMELVIDGALSTFGDTSASIFTIRAVQNKDGGGEEFLALFAPSAGLVRYYFDETVPAMPDKEIRIYSLEENVSVRQAITAYKKEHTDMYVRYEVGLTEEDGVTAEDALRKLNTQVLAGEGPDVMILDGLPVDSYIEKGMLLDISEVLDGLPEEDAPFPNLLEAFRTEDGAVYGMPLCICVPLLAGEKESIGRIENLESFAEEMEKLRRENPEGALLAACDAGALIRQLGMVSSSAWTKETGEIDREKVAEFLYQAKRIYDAETAGTLVQEQAALEAEYEEMAEYGMDILAVKQEICHNVLYLPRGYGRLACGYVDGIQLCLDNVTSTARITEGMDYRLFNGQEEKVFIPRVMVGVSAATENRAEAEAFVRKIFGKEAQENIAGGFPVNQSAFESSFDFYEPGADNGTMTLEKKDGSELELQLYWPDEKEEAAFLALVRELKTPAAENTWLNELVCEIGTEVLEGKISVEEGAEKIGKKAALYLAE